MKSEQEFLTAMWSEIHRKEQDARETHLALKKNRRLLIKELFTYGVLAALLVIGGLLAFWMQDNAPVVYVVSMLLLTAAYYSERLFHSKSREGTVDEN